MNKAVIKRIIDWNKARYIQKYDQALTEALLTEEVGELLDAITEVDMLDALVDIYYVSVGALWKLGTHPDFILQSEVQIPLDQLPSILENIKTDYTKYGAYPFLNLLGVIATVTDGMRQMLKTDERIAEAILIVCDSNDSKVIARTRS